MANRPYYQVLEVGESASHEEIHTAYRRLLKEYHPDRVPEHLKRLKSDAEEKLKEINEAWAVLGDTTKRQQYDATLKGRPAEHQSGQAREEEVNAIMAEMQDPRSFFALCQNRPDEVLGKISKVESCAPELANNPGIILFRAIALAHRILKTRVHAGELTGRLGQEECGQALSELLRARKITMSENMSGVVVAEVERLVDEAAILLERSAAGSAQEVMGTTKLKYIGLANRMKEIGKVESWLTPSELREILEMPFKTPFIIRFGLLNAMMPMAGRKTVVVMLYEQEDIWGPTGQIVASKGMLTFEKDDSPLGRWRLQITCGGAAAEPSQRQPSASSSAKSGSDSLFQYRRRLLWCGILLGGVLGFLLFTVTPDGPARNGIAVVAALVAIIAAIVVGAQLGNWGGGIGAFFAAAIALEVTGAISPPAYCAEAWATILAALFYTCARPLYGGKLAGKRGPLFGVVLGGLALFGAIVVGGIAWSRQGLSSGPVQHASPPQTAALPASKARRPALVRRPGVAANSQTTELAPLETGVVATCSEVRGWKDYTPKTEFHPGEAVCVYAEALNVNQSGRADVSFLSSIRWMDGPVLAYKESSYTGAIQGTDLWHWDAVPLPQAPTGKYTAVVYMRNNLTGQKGNASTNFTVLPSGPSNSLQVSSQQTSASPAANTQGVQSGNNTETDHGYVHETNQMSAQDYQSAQQQEPVSSLEPVPCTEEGNLRSKQSVTPSAIEFENKTYGEVHIHWLNQTGRRVFYKALAPSSAYVQSTFLTNPWVAADSQDRCLSIFLPGYGTRKTIVKSSR